MFEKVVNIISAYTELPKEQITEDTNMLTDLGLQSIDFIDMICDFEEEFEKVVPERDFRKLTTVKKIIEYIENSE
ncbi:MAG: phosphopantetheine-binding protein [Oscillospiraceae bacterium]|nr:phosphopantetheine-binding protein [Oscillospiraceae bacterium]